MHTLVSLFDTGASPISVKKDFLPLTWRKSTKTNKSTLLGTANCKVVSFEGIVSLFVCMGGLRMSAWFGVVKNLAVDVLLGTSFIDRRIWGIFLIEQKFVP